MMFHSSHPMQQHNRVHHTKHCNMEYDKTCRDTDSIKQDNCCKAPATKSSVKHRTMATTIFRMLLALSVFVMTSAAENMVEQGCIWRSSMSLSMPWVQEAEPRSGCTSGELHWYWPKGVLTANFRHEKANLDFRLCLRFTDSSNLAGVYYTSVAGVNTYIDVPAIKDAETCVNSADGKVRMSFEAVSERIRVTVIKYVIKDT